MSRIRPQDEIEARAFEPAPGGGGRGARYIEHLERFPERDFEPGVVRRARALVRAVRGLGSRFTGRDEGGGPRKGGG
ncbi:MAG TPA: hypothetical protein VIF14_12265 [Alphaproteobacteria bacterium]|jgi:hypothetical protein